MTQNVTGFDQCAQPKGTGRMEDNTDKNQPCTRYDRLPIAGKGNMAERPETALHTHANELNGVNTSMAEN